MDGPIVVKLKGGSGIDLKHVASVDCLHKEEGAHVINDKEGQPIDCVYVYVEGRVRPIFDKEDILKFMTAWNAFEWDFLK